MMNLRSLAILALLLCAAIDSCHSRPARTPTTSQQTRGSPRRESRAVHSSASQAQVARQHRARIGAARRSDAGHIGNAKAQRKGYKGGGVVHRAQQDRQRIFDHHWQAEKLHTDLDPTELANRVILMQKRNIMTPMALAKLASSKVKQKGDTNYDLKYHARINKLSTYLGREMTEIKKNIFTKDLPADKQLDLGLEAAFKKTDQHEKKRKRIESLVTSSMPPEASEKTAQMTIDRVGKLLKDQVQAQGLDFRKIPLRHLEEEIKKVAPLPDMEPGYFKKTLYRYVQYEKELPELIMEGIKKRLRNEERNARKKAKVAHNRQRQQAPPS